LWPEAKLTLVPPLADRFYYDIDMPPIREEGLRAHRSQDAGAVVC
jgi:threonyl-tRNA synthetase